MTIVLWFFAPLLVYIALYFYARTRLRRTSLIAAALIAFISSMAVLKGVFFSSHWPKGTEVAWTGIESTGDALSIGGPLEKAVVGWPNGSFAPSLKVTAISDDLATLEITAGRAFIFDESTGNCLNGTVIGPGEPQTFGEYTFHISRDWLFWRYRLEISGSEHQTLADFRLPAFPEGRARVYSLEGLIETTEYKTRPDWARLIELKEWASGVRLLLTDDKEIRILEREKTWQAQCQLPCRLSVLWINLKQELVLRKQEGKVTLHFLPPWRLASPLPPPSGDKKIRLVVTGRVLPGDTAFLLPLGRAGHDPRAELLITQSHDHPPRFSSPGAIVTESEAEQDEYLPPEFRMPKISDPELGVGVTSRISVAAGPISYQFATVNDLPRPRTIALLVALALLLFFFGLWLVRIRMPDMAFWVICGLAAVLWNLLAFRLLLALRYSLDPSYLDSLVVKGLTVAFVSLAVVPGLFLLTARLSRDYFARPAKWEERKKALRDVLVYLITLIVAFGVEYRIAPELWANLPPRFAPSLGFVAFIALGMLLLYLALSALVVYLPEPGTKFNILWIFIPWGLTSGLARVGKNIWSTIATASWSWQRIVLYTVVGFIWVALVPFLLSLFPTRKFVQEVIAPVVFCLPFAIFWLSSKLHFTVGSKVHQVSWSKIAFCAFLTIILPVFLLPLAVRDVGSVLATLAIFIPVGFLLVAATPRSLGIAVILPLTAAIVLADVVYATFSYSYLPGEAGVRVLTFRKGGAIQRYILFADSIKAEAGVGLSMQKLRNAYQHIWENKAIAHEGGMLGLGFGNAPARRSQVRQDTIQHDSVFSFFVLSEHGLLGGFCLLLIYAVPLTLILLSARDRFDLGHAIGCVIAAAFLLEALFHAGMNVGVLPFTGRNLPLLSVNSVAGDILRWGLLFCLVTQTLLWRYTGKRDGPTGPSDFRPEAISIVSPKPPAGHVVVEEAKSYWWAVSSITFIPLILALSVAGKGWKNVRDPELDNPFGWEGVLEVVSRMCHDGIIKLNESDLTISLDTSRIKASGTSLIEEEIAYFNALPLEARKQGTGPKDLLNRLGSVSDLKGYDQFLDEIRQQSEAQPERRRPPLFRLVPATQWEEGDQTNSRRQEKYHIAPNPQFNVRLSFKTGAGAAGMARTSFSNEQKLLIGPAWVRGRWVATFDPDAPLPWAANLAEALAIEWGRLGPEEAAKRYSMLSLDRKLQLAAMEFVTEKGRQLHARLLAEHRNSRDPQDKLPPRIALAVIRLPQGEVVALGGWPRMTPDRFWRKDPRTQEWIPPVHWVETEAPLSLGLRYGGDRNFDQIVIGSASKPLWATAVLAVHPGLDRKLKVQGFDGRESDVFGIRLSRDWGVTPTHWRDFTAYLAQSDNRYHVRLGFLGLAERAGGDVVADSGESNSIKESLKSGAPAPWKKYPKFPPTIGFSKNEPGRMLNLADTPLAAELKRMYSIGIRENEFKYRLSFWSKNENDDVASADGVERRSRPTSLFRVISPQAVDLALDAITEPGDYVTLLLGGGTNLWANVDFAAAFGTCVTGMPVVATVVKNQESVDLLDGRRPFPDIAARVRPGLRKVVTEGTATRALRVTHALTFLTGVPGVRVYAKTGTLRAKEGQRDTSRLVLALIKWKDERKGIVQNGLVFSIVGEQAQMGSGALWLGEFLVKTQSDIRRLLLKK